MKKQTYGPGYYLRKAGKKADNKEAQELGKQLRRDPRYIKAKKAFKVQKERRDREDIAKKRKMMYQGQHGAAGRKKSWRSFLPGRGKIAEVISEYFSSRERSK